MARQPIDRNKRIATALTAAETSPDVLLRVEAVVAKTGISRAGVYAKVASGDFPRPIRVGPRAARWHSGTVDEWIRSRMAEGAAA